MRTPTPSGGCAPSVPECLDRLMIIGRRHLERVIRTYVRHYNRHRPHRALELTAPDQSGELPVAVLPLDVRRRDLLGGLIHEYRIAA
jgi:putative transposase